MADNKSGIFATARNRRLFAVAETTFKTQVKPSASDAFRALTGIISAPQPNRITRDDNRPSRSVEALIEGNTPPSAWSYEGYLIPSGSNGVPPDVHPFLLATMGPEGDGYTNTGGTSDVYALTDTAQSRGSVSLYEAYPAGGSTDKHNVVAYSLFGATVSSMTIKGGGGDPPTIGFGGVGASFRMTGRTTVNGAPAGAAVTLTDINAVQVGSLVAFYEAADGTTLVDDSSGNGFQVLSISGSVATLDASPSGVVSTDIMAPWCPTETVAGSPVPGVQLTMTVEGVTVSPLAYEVTLDNQDTPHDNEAGQSEATNYHDGRRALSGQFSFRAKASDVAVVTRRKDIANTTIQMIFGPGDTGASMQMDVECQLNFADREAGPEDTVIFNCPIQGVATAANAKDELTLTFGNANP